MNPMGCSIVIKSVSTFPFKSLRSDNNCATRAKIQDWTPASECIITSLRPTLSQGNTLHKGDIVCFTVKSVTFTTINEPVTQAQIWST